MLLPVLLLSFLGAVGGFLTPGTYHRVVRHEHVAAVLAARQGRRERRGFRIGYELAVRLVLLPVQALAVLGAVLSNPAPRALEQMRCGRAALVTHALEGVGLRQRPLRWWHQGPSTSSHLLVFFAMTWFVVC